MTLKYFSDPEILSHVWRDILTRFLDDYKEHLPADAAALLPARLDFEQFCQAWAAQFSSPSRFGAPLLDALLAIENLAQPENESLLKEALSHLPPGYVVNQNLPPLHQSLHLWIIAQNTPGVYFPQTSSKRNEDRPQGVSSSPSEAQQTRKPNETGEPSADRSCNLQPSSCNTPPIAAGNSGSTPVVENQNSKIENSFHRLALLSPVEYEFVRRDEAKRLNLRVSTLDDAVERARILEDDAQANALKLPQLEPWPEPISNAPALFDNVHDRCLLYLYLPAGAAVVLTLWPAHAQAIKAFTLTPRLNFTSTEPGCGKTTALDFLAALSPNVLRTDNLKTAVLFRVVEQQQPTLLLDELDTYLHLYPDLRGLLNSGHSNGGYAHRCEGNKVRAFSSFAATALAGIGDLAKTLRDRSITVALFKAPPGVLKARFDKRHVETETILGRKMARWVQDNFDAIAACDPIMPRAAHNRLGDNWRPLFAIAQLIGGHWPQRILEAFTALTTRKEASNNTAVVLLADIRTIFNQTGDSQIFSSMLADSLCSMPERPWSSINRGKPITQLWLARRLHSFGIGSHILRIGDARANGYLLSDFTDSFAKFLDNHPGSKGSQV